MMQPHRNQNFTWDHRADIVVLGYGYAGAATAIYARDAGVEKVVILEKAPHFGGYSILSGGVVLGGTDYEGMLRYFKALCAGRTPDEVIEAQVEGLTKVHDYVRELCAINGAKFEVVGKPGASGSGDLIWEKISASCYPLPGGESLTSGLITELPGFDGYPWLMSPYPGGLLMKVLEDNVNRRGVDARFSTPAREILTDENGLVCGVKAADPAGREIFVRASQAVIIASGGFESNEWMKLQYCEAKPIYSIGPSSNTGDGILMAQKLGAALWHMWHIHGSYGFKFPECPTAFRIILGGFRLPKRKLPWILVDKIKGQRFMNEFHPAPQDTMHRPLEYFEPDLQDFPRIPAWMIFDERGRKMGPIAKPLAVSAEDSYDWSADNNKEIEKGWISKAASIDELAQIMGVNSKNLRQTIDTWNQSCQGGEDDDFGRLPGTMVPISRPPYHAVKVWPVVTNTQGGPEHNAKQQVVDAFSRPIPRLYAVGECGSFYGHLYQLSGNISECVISGKIAGECAAQEVKL